MEQQAVTPIVKLYPTDAGLQLLKYSTSITRQSPRAQILNHITKPRASLAYTRNRRMMRGASRVSIGMWLLVTSNLTLALL